MTNCVAVPIFFLYDVVQLQTATYNALQSYTKMDSNLKSIHISVSMSIIYMNVAGYVPKALK